MRIIEKGNFKNENLSIEELSNVNGAFCGVYRGCKSELGVTSICKPRIGGSKTCFNHEYTKLTEEGA